MYRHISTELSVFNTYIYTDTHTHPNVSTIVLLLLLFLLAAIWHKSCDAW